MHGLVAQHLGKIREGSLFHPDSPRDAGYMAGTSEKYASEMMSHKADLRVG